MIIYKVYIIVATNKRKKPLSTDNLDQPIEHAQKVPHLSPKSCHSCTLWFRERRNWSVVVTELMLVSRPHANTSNPDVYWRKQPNRQNRLELCHRNPNILERMLNRIALSNSAVGKCASMQVTKQPEHGRTSTTKEQKWSSFQGSYDQ